MAPDGWAAFRVLLIIGGVIGVVIVVLAVAFEVEMMIRGYREKGRG